MRKLKLAFYWISLHIGLFALSRRLTRRYLKILCYHAFEVRDETLFRPRLFMSGTVFRRRMETLAKYGMNVLPLDRALRDLYAGTLTPESVVITIDDGFQSVKSVAAPVLREKGFSSTLYVTSYYVENDAPVFRLVVQYMFERTKRKKLKIAGMAWHANGEIDLTNMAQRESVVEQCIEYGESVDEATRSWVSVELGQLLDIDYEEIKRLRMFHLLKPSDITTIGESGIDIQLHTHRHRFSMQNFEEVKREIEDNRASLGRILPQQFEHFCYPSGEWQWQHGPWLESLGVRSATTCVPGFNSPNTSPFELRRFVDGEDIHQLEFEAALSGFSDILRIVRNWVEGASSSAFQHERPMTTS